MKNTMKKLLAFVLTCAMVLSMGAVGVFAMEVEESVNTNWTPLAGAFAYGTWNIKAPASKNYEIQTQGFEFNENDYGGLSVITPDYNTIKAGYPSSFVSSKATTPLDGLTVVLTADQYDSYIDSLGGGNTLGIIWSEDRIEEFAHFDETTKSYDQGLFSAVPVQSNGLRNVMPFNPDAVLRTPASAEVAQGNAVGRSLYIGISTDFQRYDDASPRATTVNIVYSDGYYIGQDGHTGYRWSFTARNHENTPNGDYTGISSDYLDIDLTDGLVVKVRADETLGYIVSINGVDYCDGEDVVYFPDAYADDWTGYVTDDVDFTNENFETLYPDYVRTMTYQKTDVTLTGLKNAEGEEPAQGYLAIGGCSNYDKNLPDHHCNYTVGYINGVPAVQWAGETVAEDHTCEAKLVQTIETSCAKAGKKVYVYPCGCQDTVIEEIEQLPHTLVDAPDKNREPTCSVPGATVQTCTVCGQDVETEIPTIDHTFGDWYVETPVTAEAAGVKARACTVCGHTEREEFSEHECVAGEAWTVVTPATCTTAGSEVQTCTICATVMNTREIAIDPTAHGESTDWDTVLTENNDWDGTEVCYCADCGEVVDERTVDINEIVSVYTDVAEGAWYIGGIAYCTYKGYMSGTSATTAAPDATLTRAQFVTLLANLDGADLAQYAEVENDFVDVNKGQWFYNAVTWAATEGYANGVGGGKFDPDANVTRAQLAKFFYVYSEKNGGDMAPTNDLSDFSDGTTVPGWAVDYIKWAVGSGLIAGMSGAVNGDGFATRAQAAKIFMVFDNL